jgi:hypothetical protein
MVYIKNKGIQLSLDIPEELREEVMAIVKGKGEGEISDEAFKYIMDGAEVVANAPAEEEQPAPVVEEFVQEIFEEGKVAEQPKPKNNKKNKNQLS